MSCDVLIVGSGPAGVNAAVPLVEAGLEVTMLDVGNQPQPEYQQLPDRPFAELRKHDADQHRYFIGKDFEGIPYGKVRVGAQLTPPRQFVYADVSRLMPVLSESFSLLESLAQGGLGSAWGANVFPFSDEELRLMALRRSDLDEHYRAVAERIGMSAAHDDLEPWMGGYPTLQPPLEIDANAERIAERYRRKRSALNRQGFYLGRTPLAICTQPHRGRPAHAYHDMDFWTNSDRSVYRPRWTLDELRRAPNFRYVDRTFVRTFHSPMPSSVSVQAVHSETNEPRQFEARALVLAAGTFSTARIALRSFQAYDRRLPLLCNPYTYIPVVNLGMLGRAPRDRRHGLAQLTCYYRPPEDAADAVQTQFYSYRSLLTFKLLRENPLGSRLGIRVFRSLMHCLGILAINHSDHFSERKNCRLERIGSDGADALRVDYELDAAQVLKHAERERRIRRTFRSLGCLALKTIRPGHGSSIHYGGTLAMSEADRPFTCTSEGRLRGAGPVFVADASTFRHLPAKGLTFTIMAQANRVGTAAARLLAQNATGCAA